MTVIRIHTHAHDEHRGVSLSSAMCLTADMPQGATDKMIAAADACYANDWGCSIHQLGLRELITEARRTDASEYQLQPVSQPSRVSNARPQAVPLRMSGPCTHQCPLDTTFFAV